MKALFQYFNPNQNIGLFEKQKAKALILISFIGLILIVILFIQTLFFKSGNTNFTAVLSIIFALFVIINLFILKLYGIKLSGNILSIGLIVIMLISLNILTKDVSALIKYVHGFYTIFAILSVTALFASRTILIISTICILATTFRVYLFAKGQLPSQIDILGSGFIFHSITLIIVTMILYFVIKFSERAINEAKEDARIKGVQNQELLSGEEEIRSSLEELRSTTDALNESYIELEKAKDKADESNKLKSIFLSNISHEIRTPLNGIVGFSDMISQDETLNDENSFYADVIVKSSEQLLRILDDILEISKLESKKSRLLNTKFNINELIAKIIEENNNYALKKKLELSFINHLTEKESQIVADYDKLYKIISKLTENAVKFTKDGYVKIITKLNNNKLEFFIKDTGVGIDKEASFNIFEKFVQANESISSNYGGLGVGLTIAKRNVELLNSELLLKTIEGKGSIFYFSIDYESTSIIEANTTSMGSNNSKLNKDMVNKILVVDDEFTNLLVLGKLLKKMDFNFEVYEAQSGKEAIDTVKSNTDISIVLMDIKMPGIDGFEATNIIKEISPNICVIMQSAYIEKGEEEKAFEIGCIDFITKPIKKVDLEVVLNKYLNK